VLVVQYAMSLVTVFYVQVDHDRALGLVASLLLSSRCCSSIFAAAAQQFQTQLVTV